MNKQSSQVDELLAQLAQEQARNRKLRAEVMRWQEKVIAQNDTLLALARRGLLPANQEEVTCHALQ
ncbi:hypothetical protein [Desulfovibrio desulfuricans]|uniref:hypothetical protein n=1 Tax=Desulfovibrio desulfuricans TaxID=876 RepID=UPI001C014987|nr:hypothetical protein [Desulfovibrio desulfuricans]MBT9749844.1 hypothetical protein [Desulfovibrio desulfuricans]